MNRKQRRQEKKLRRQSVNPAVAAPLGQAAELHQNGRVEEALRIYRRLRGIDPRHVDVLTLGGLACYQLGGNDEALQWLQAAIAHHPGYAPAHCNIAIVHFAQGRYQEAAEAAGRATRLDPAHAPSHNALGNALLGLGRTDEAVAAYRRAVAHDPGFADAHSNMGLALKRLGRVEDAVAALERALAGNPRHTEALNNLGHAFLELERPAEALVHLERAVEVNPRYATAHVNVGIARQKSGDLEGAVESYRHALAIDPDHAEGHCNLGFALNDLGDVEGAIAACEAALRLKPGLLQVYENLVYPFVTASLEGRPTAGLIERLATAAPASAEPWFLQYALDRLTPEAAVDGYRRAAARLPAAAAAPDPQEAAVVALFHFGRSGSGFLHSLIDGHSRVSTLPGVYMKGFFGSSVWPELSAGGGEGLVDRFSTLYEVLFDATHPKGVPGNPTWPPYAVGESEGFTRMGEDRAQALGLDRAAFARNLTALLGGLENVDQGTFFRLLHVAFEKTLGRAGDPDVLFYHIHNPTDLELANFLKHFPGARLLVILRDPVQSLESWVSRDFATHGNYLRIVSKIAGMLSLPERCEFTLHQSAGVRLEDLKNDAAGTIARLCRWMGIDEEPTLYSSTMQGLCWWGEPTGAAFASDDPFDSKPLRRPGGDVFSERDRLVLSTLFHPVRAAYGYGEAGGQGLLRDLDTIRPLIDEPFDFERTLFERFPIHPRGATGHGLFRYFHQVLLKRWRMLHQRRGAVAVIPPLVS